MLKDLLTPPVIVAIVGYVVVIAWALVNTWWDTRQNKKDINLLWGKVNEIDKHLVNTDAMVNQYSEFRTNVLTELGEMKEALTEVAKNGTTALRDHEILDQQRHEQGLERIGGVEKNIKGYIDLLMKSFGK